MSRRFAEAFVPLSLGALLAVSAGALISRRSKAAAPPPPPPNGPAFVGDFSNPKLPKWVTHGTFSVKDGKLILGNPNNNRENSWVYANPGDKVTPPNPASTTYTNFTVEMTARLLSDPAMWGGFGIWFRTNGAGQFRNDDWNPDGGSGYVFDYVPGLKAVTLQRRSHAMLIGGDPKPAPVDHNLHTFRVDAIGPHIVAYLDGSKVFDTVHSEKPFGYTNGQVGIGVFNRGSVEVDSFKITPH